MSLPTSQSGELRARYPIPTPVKQDQNQEFPSSPKPHLRIPVGVATLTRTRIKVSLSIIFSLAILAFLFFLWSFHGRTPISSRLGVNAVLGQVSLDSLAFIEQLSQQPNQIPIPVIDRSILDRLDPPKPGSGRKAKSSWPPIITRIPESSSSSFSTWATSSDTMARYLIPIRIAEQESKARIHLSQLYILAQALNRTLVLPNVGKSRLGICNKWGFGVYYDLDSAEGFGVKISEVAFKRKGTQMVYLKNKLKRKQMEIELAWEEYKGLMVAMDGTQKPNLPGCLASKVDTGLPTMTPVIIYPKDTSDGAQPIGDALVEVLQRQEADVLLLDHDLRFPIFPSSTLAPIVNYSPLLVQLAEQLAGDGYIMVHWRMESVPPANLPGCADTLVDLLDSLLHESDTRRRVWFASDYSYTTANLLDCQVQETEEQGQGKGHQLKSNTFKRIFSEHDQAIQILKEAFCPGGVLDGWNLTDLTTEMRWIDPANFAVELSQDVLRDPGVLGILDKVVGMRAEVFVSGKKGCARKSSFTKQIVDARSTSPSRDRSVVEYFG
ncbi:proteophosphoglycan 5 [Moniliophthora roreri MCA 2997]|uniref:Proteophosphoglycan 5 n=1 Tax=Moniliophthora roreri (strain MCA 2997) TaxID=1381753 RepID=V2Y201_MONRO|nr:proteophosphoglycan 5 [Moniliophthora roreri MCA 2997]